MHGFAMYREGFQRYNIFTGKVMAVEGVPVNGREG
jgi:hypothetical protein